MIGSKLLARLFQIISPIYEKYKFYSFGYWIIFPFFLKIISRFFKDEIDEELIVMGANAGVGFLDDPKYLFKFLNERSKYRVVWITKLNTIFTQLKKEGYNVVPYYSLEAIKLLRTAKFIFFNHGIYDVLPIKFSSKTIKILTLHGTFIKKSNKNLDKSFIYRKWGDIFKLKLKYEQYVDYVLTPTGKKRERRIISSTYKVSSKKIIELGYARNDILFNTNNELINKIKKNYNIPNEIKRNILYCPTWRDNNLKKKLPFNIYQLKKLNDLLIKTDTLFLIKAHMSGFEIDTNLFQNIKFIPKQADIQELYLITNILITDYSSTMLDFSLLDRPILLYPYDLDNYLKVRGMHYNLEEIAPGPLFFTADDLIEGIRNIDELDVEYREKRKRIREMFNRYIDGNSTERILNFFKIKFH